MGSVCSGEEETKETNVSVKVRKSGKKNKAPKKNKGSMQRLKNIDTNDILEYADREVRKIHRKLGYYELEISEKEHEELKIMTLPDGRKYKGEWDASADLPHGKGIMVYNDGSLYIGEFNNGECEGKGRVIHQNGDVYDGDWYQNLADGRGVLYTSDGQKYEGDFEADKKHGEGNESWPDGTKYSGQYKK